MENKEIWENIVEWDGYEVSILGRVKSRGRTVSRKGIPHPIRERVLKQQVTPFGYCEVHLYKKGKGKNAKVHRLVAKAFIPNPKNKPYINHIDCDKKNNRVENLEWVTPQENVDHTHKMGRNRNHRGEEVHTAKLKPHQVLEIRRLKGIKLQKELAKEYGVSMGCVADIHAGRKWKHLLQNGYLPKPKI